MLVIGGKTLSFTSFLCDENTISFANQKTGGNALHHSAIGYTFQPHLISSLQRVWFLF